MKNGEEHRTEEDPAAVNAAAAGSNDGDDKDPNSKLMEERKASSGSSAAVAIDRFRARVRKKLLTGYSSNSQSVISSANKPAAIKLDNNDNDIGMSTSSAHMTREEEGRLNMEVIEDDVAAPIPLQMEISSEEEENLKVERYQQKINQAQQPSAVTVTTSSSIAQQQNPTTRPPPRSSLRHDTLDVTSDDLYAVSAELVDDSIDTPEQCDEEVVYEAIVIPRRWFHYKVIVGTGVVLIIAAAIALGIVFGKRNGPTSRITPPSTQQPTYDCVVRYDGPLNEKCLYFCSVAFDGDVGIMAMNNSKSVQFLSLNNQTLTLEAVSANYIDSGYGPVAISGNVAVLGVNNGGVQLFERDATNTDTWNETVFLLPGDCPEDGTDDVCSNKANFGFSVDIDGDVMVVGAPGSLDVVGAAYLYRRNEATWVLEQKFESGVGMKRFGRVVSVKGGRIAVASQGSVVLFKFDPSFHVWKQTGNPLVSDECGSIDLGFGYSIALVGENGLLIGCPSDNNSVGSVRYYTIDPNTGEYIEEQKITPFDQSIKYFSGGDTQLKVDGDNVIISTYETRKGSVFLFTLVDDKWIETARIRAPTGIQNFGGNTALSGGHVTVSSETNVHSYFLNCI